MTTKKTILTTEDLKGKRISDLDLTTRLHTRASSKAEDETYQTRVWLGRLIEKMTDLATELDTVVDTKNRELKTKAGPEITNILRRITSELCDSNTIRMITRAATAATFELIMCEAYAAIAADNAK